jgi:hypothetical protein
MKSIDQRSRGPAGAGSGTRWRAGQALTLPASYLEAGLAIHAMHAFVIRGDALAGDQRM